MKYMNKRSGITLIALIITIIVMLILVAIVINMSANGRLFDYAGKAALDTEMAKEKEFIALAYSEATMKKQVDADTVFSDYFEDALIRHSNGRDVSVSEDEYGYIVEFRDVNRTYVVNEDGTTDEVVAIEDETPGELAGTGTQNDPYKVQSIEDLVVLSIMVSGGDQGLGIEENDFSGEYVSLEKSLNFKSRLSYCDATTTVYDTYLGGNGSTTLINELSTGNGLRPIGGYIDLETRKSFKGIFLGNNNELRNIYITDKYRIIDGEFDDIRAYVLYGLFGYVENARIDSLKVYGLAESDYECGGIVGKSNNSTINNCTSGVEFLRIGYMGGGIVGYTLNNSTITNCKYNGIINLYGNFGLYIGGITGYCIDSTFTDCENCGTITLKRTEAKGYVGGISSYISSGTFNGCKNKGTLNLNNIERSGGIAGTVKSAGVITLTGCSNEANINVTNNEVLDTNKYYVVGGLLGISGQSTNITSCYNNGNINAENLLYVGGVVGYGYATNYTDSKIIDTHNKADVISKGNCVYVGGIVGSKKYNVIACCSNTGTVDAQNNWNISLYAGGIVGIIGEHGLVCSCYNSGPVKSVSAYKALAGGIQGYSKYSFMGHCYNTGVISGVGASETTLGGVAGTERAGQIFGCYNKGEIHLLNDYNCTTHSIGGVAGLCYYSIKSMNAYNFGDIIVPSNLTSVGGTYGMRYVNGGGDGTDFIDFYYETHTWPYTSYDAGIATAVESIDVEQMIADIADAREDFGALSYTEEEPILSQWVIDENINDGYPILSWQVQS